MPKYDLPLQEGMCYIVSDFNVTNNEGLYPLFNNRYKIVFSNNTLLNPIYPFHQKMKSFMFVPFKYIISRFRTEADTVGMFFSL